MISFKQYLITFIVFSVWSMTADSLNKNENEKEKEKEKNISDQCTIILKYAGFNSGAKTNIIDEVDYEANIKKNLEKVEACFDNIIFQKLQLGRNLGAGRIKNYFADIAGHILKVGKKLAAKYVTYMKGKVVQADQESKFCEESVGKSKYLNFIADLININN